MFRMAQSTLTRAEMSVIALGVNHQFILTSQLCKAVQQNSCRGFHADYMGKASRLLWKILDKSFGQASHRSVKLNHELYRCRQTKRSFIALKGGNGTIKPCQKISHRNILAIFLLLFGDISMCEAHIYVFLTEVCSLMLSKVYAATVNYFSMRISYGGLTSSVNRNR